MKVYDNDIRKVLYKEFVKRKSYIATHTVVVDEMDVCAGSSRVDIAVINGSMHGYEIKSKQDTLERLPGQMNDYNKIFDTMTIVGFESHIEKIINIVPEWWGVKSVCENKERIELKTIRKEKKNRNVDINNLVLLLWRDEMINMIINYSDISKGYKSKSRQQLGAIIVNNIDEVSISKYVRETLKTRLTWKAVPIQQLNDDYMNK